MGLGMQWHQLDHVQTICTSLQTDYHTNTSSLNFLQAGCSSRCPTNSVKAHTHPFNGPFFQDYPGEPVPERWNQSGFYWSKRQWVAVASAGLYASLHLAPDRQPCQHPTTLFFTGRTPFVPPNQQRQSTEGSVLKKHWRKLKINNTQGKINEHVLKAL